jgi:SAM-dependent methyltransferase
MPVFETTTLPSEVPCPVCGSKEFTQKQVLSPELVSDWALLPYEQQYIEEQQGLSCDACGSNLRAMTLALAILTAYRFPRTLREWAGQVTLSILEVNEAFSLSRIFHAIPGHTLACYPEIDLQELPYVDGSFDLIVHSDTLEHVPDPIRALSECRRVIKPRGHLAYTVPMIVDRMSRSRCGMAPSYHANEKRPDFLVRTEFGADFWTYPMRAGFKHVELIAIRYPASVAILASTGSGA